MFSTIGSPETAIAPSQKTRVRLRTSLKTVLGSPMCVILHPQAPAQTPGEGVAEIQARHDRAFINELGQYLQKNPSVHDRDQAYAALFNKAIEHDWFGDVEKLAGQYLKSDPDGPVKALAQIIQTMARAHAGQFDLALEHYRVLMQGLGQDEQEEFAASFSENLAATAVAAGDVGTARQVYTLCSLASATAQTCTEGSGRAEAARQGRKTRPPVCLRRREGEPGASGLVPR